MEGHLKLIFPSVIKKLFLIDEIAYLRTVYLAMSGEHLIPKIRYE